MLPLPPPLRLKQHRLPRRVSLLLLRPSLLPLLRSSLRPSRATDHRIAGPPIIVARGIASGLEGEVRLLFSVTAHITITLSPPRFGPRRFYVYRQKTVISCEG